MYSPINGGVGRRLEGSRLCSRLEREALRSCNRTRSVLAPGPGTVGDVEVLERSVRIGRGEWLVRRASNRESELKLVSKACFQSQTRGSGDDVSEAHP